MKRKRWVRLLTGCLAIMFACQTLPMVAFAEQWKTSAAFAEKSLNRTMPGAKKEEPKKAIGELTEKRDENTKHFLLEDGSFAAAIYEYPVHYQEKTREWKEIDNTLQEAKGSSGEAVYQNQSSPVAVRFAKNGNSAELVAIETSAGKLAWGLRAQPEPRSARSTPSTFQVVDDAVAAPQTRAANSNEETPKSNGMEATKAVSQGIYRDILPEVDLEYTIKSNSVKENVILKSKAAPSSVSFTVSHAGLEVRKEADGSVSFFDPAKPDSPVYTFETPFAYDAKHDLTGQVSFVLEQGQGQSVLTLQVDEEWLYDKKREFPVVVDPYTQPEAKSTNIMDTFVKSSQPNSTVVGSYGSFVVGKNYDYGACRAFVKFNTLPKLDNGDMIYDAYLELAQYEFSAVGEQKFHIAAYEPKGSWAENATTWNNQPGFDSHELDFTEVNGTRSYRQLNITKLVRQWYNTGVNNGVMLKSMGMHLPILASTNWKRTGIGIFSIRTTKSWRNNMIPI